MDSYRLNRWTINFDVRGCDDMELMSGVCEGILCPTLDTHCCHSPPWYYHCNDGLP